MQINLLLNIGYCLLVAVDIFAIGHKTKRIYFDESYWAEDVPKDSSEHLIIDNSLYDLQTLATGENFIIINSNDDEVISSRRKRETIEYDEIGNRVYNVGVLMASHLGKWDEFIVKILYALSY